MISNLNKQLINNRDYCNLLSAHTRQLPLRGKPQ